MLKRTVLCLCLILGCSTLGSAAEPITEIPPQYRVEPPHLPAADLSGQLGQRLLRLLHLQAIKSLKWMDGERRIAGITNGSFVINVGADGKRMTGEYNVYEAMTSAYTFAIVARYGELGKTMGGTTRQSLETAAVALLRAVAATHPVSGSDRIHPEWWPKPWALRVGHVFGMAAWLLWDKLDPPMQLLVARILEHDADLYNNDAAPAKLIDDTQAESNAWTASGIALASCMLKHHPRRAIWDAKAKEFMISAFATPDDVASSRIIDGKPLNQWIKAPNIFSDYTLENHGYVFPDYMATTSEMVRSAMCYRLADEPVPHAVTFNADKMLEQLAIMSMPAGHYFYVQGTDYFSRRLDSIFQAGNVLPLKPDPLLNGVFLRSLASMERMAAAHPDRPMNGWDGMNLDFGSMWGLTENYLMRRLFGSGGPALPDDQIDAKLAGVHVYKDGKFAIHRTAKTISSFSWHTSAKASEVMGLIMPLTLDTLCYPMPGSFIGELTETPPNPPPAKQPETRVRLAKVNTAADGFGVLTELDRCCGKVLQKCAFVSLPDGTAVYIEDRIAAQPVAFSAATSGNVLICDDTRWLFQSKPRVYHSAAGPLTPDPSKLTDSNWINIDDQLGLVAVGKQPLRLFRVTSNPCIFRGTGTMLDTCHIEFVHTAPGTNLPSIAAGQRISRFAVIASPGASTRQTRSLAAAVTAAGWHTDANDILALRVGPYLVYANFSPQKRSIAWGGGSMECMPQCAGWSSTVASHEFGDGNTDPAR